jgi:hypothetical protein
MKIESNVIKTFLKKTRLDGDQKIDVAKLVFEDSGLKILATAPTKVCRTNGWLKNTAFKEYIKIDNVCFNDLTNVQNCFDRFKDVVSIKKEGNLFNISGTGKKVDIELVSEEFLPTEPNETEMKFENVFNISSSELKEIIKDVELNKDASLVIKSSDKKIIFSNTGKYKFETTIEAPSCKEGTVVKFGKPFIDCVKNLEGMLQISIGTDYPCKILEQTDESVISIIVAPLVTDD